jgi:hypothetical protein
LDKISAGGRKEWGVAILWVYSFSFQNEKFRMDVQQYEYF